MTADRDTLADTIRVVIDDVCGSCVASDLRVAAASDALAALLARLHDAEQEIDDALVSIDGWTDGAAPLANLEEGLAYIAECWRDASDRAEAAEGRVRQLEAALEHIAGASDESGTRHYARRMLRPAVPQEADT